MNRDSSEIERAYRENRRGFLAWASRATRDLAEAEDLVQEAFAEAVFRSEALEAVDDLVAWLFATLRNKARDLWRRRETRPRSI